jgi:hypothetical protein
MRRTIFFIEDIPLAPVALPTGYRCVVDEHVLRVTKEEMGNPSNRLPEMLLDICTEVAKYMSWLAGECGKFLADRLEGEAEPSHRIAIVLADSYHYYQDHCGVKLPSNYMGSFPSNSPATVRMACLFSHPVFKDWPQEWAIHVDGNKHRLRRPMFYMEVGMWGISLKLQVINDTKGGVPDTIFTTGFRVEKH